MINVQSVSYLTLVNPQYKITLMSTMLLRQANCKYRCRQNLFVRLETTRSGHFELFSLEKILSGNSGCSRSISLTYNPFHWLIIISIYLSDFRRSALVSDGTRFKYWLIGLASDFCRHFIQSFPFQVHLIEILRLFPHSQYPISMKLEWMDVYGIKKRGGLAEYWTLFR